MEQKDLSIITVNYKTPKLLFTCIESVYKYTSGLDFEIIVVDNNSEDESEDLIKENFKDVIWINSGYNAGTSFSNNLGVKNSSGRYVLFLNSDTEVIDNAIFISYEKYLKKEKEFKLGLLVCQLIGYDNIIQFNSNLYFRGLNDYLRANPIFIKLNLLQDKLTEEQRHEIHMKDHESEWLGIPFGIINANVLKTENHFFDEDIFMYSDEVEWCYRLKKHGYKHYFTSAATIIHYNGGSCASLFSKWRHGQIVLSSWLCLIKMEGKLYFLICMSVFLINYIMNSILYFKNEKFGETHEIDLSEKKIREFDLETFNKYFLKLLFKYSKKTSANGKFLKYE
jgi:GT2 family glycosyltransferase